MVATLREAPAPRTAAYALLAGGSKQNKTDVKMDYSYWAGIYGEKQLSARWSVDIGLNLHYYSVRFQTKNQVNSYAPTSASLFARTAFTYCAAMLRATYSNAIVNRPMLTAIISWKSRSRFSGGSITSRSLPLFWRGGAVLSYLVSSNGLYYDASSRDL